jgi:hypothetical protein
LWQKQNPDKTLTCKTCATDKGKLSLTLSLKDSCGLKFREALEKFCQSANQKKEKKKGNIQSKYSFFLKKIASFRK